MYDQYAYYHYETVEEKPVPKPPVLVSFSEERAAKQRREEKGLWEEFTIWNYLFHFLTKVILKLMYVLSSGR